MSCLFAIRNLAVDFPQKLHLNSGQQREKKHNYRTAVLLKRSAFSAIKPKMPEAAIALRRPMSWGEDVRPPPAGLLPVKFEVRTPPIEVYSYSQFFWRKCQHVLVTCTCLRPFSCNSQKHFSRYLCMCICSCIHIHIYVYMYIYICMNVCMYVDMYVDMYGFYIYLNMLCSYVHICSTQKLPNSLIKVYAIKFIGLVTVV